MFTQFCYFQLGIFSCKLEKNWEYDPISTVKWARKNPWEYYDQLEGIPLTLLCPSMKSIHWQIKLHKINLGVWPECQGH